MADSKFIHASASLHLNAARISRFWNSVDMSGTGCWPWTGVKDRYGYGQTSFRHEGKKLIFKAHRVAYFLTKGRIDHDLQVQHACDNPACCNPSCLSQGTPRQNTQDAKARGRLASRIGERNTQAKLKEGDVREIRRLHAAGAGTLNIAAVYGVGYQTVCRIVSHRLWRHI